MIPNCRDKLADFAETDRSPLTGVGESPAKGEAGLRAAGMRKKIERRENVTGLGKWPDQPRIHPAITGADCEVSPLVSVAYRSANFAIYSRNSRRLKYIFQQPCVASTLARITLPSGVEVPLRRSISLPSFLSETGITVPLCNRGCCYYRVIVCSL